MRLHFFVFNDQKIQKNIKINGFTKKEECLIILTTSITVVNNIVSVIELRIEGVYIKRKILGIVL